MLDLADDRQEPEPAGGAHMLKEGMARAQIVTVPQRYAHDINRISALIPQDGGRRRVVEHHRANC